MPPGVWDSGIEESGNNNNEEGPYSGSTITPPTPSKNNAMMLFDDDDSTMFVVSIEPHVGSNDNNVSTTSAIVSNCEHDTNRKKRGREEIMMDMPTTKNVGSSTVGPAFFHCNPPNSTIDKDAVPKEKSEVNDTVTNNNDDTSDVMDIDHDNTQQDDSTVDGGGKLKLHINSDPSICTFEAVIMKKLPPIVILGNGGLSTPKQQNNQQDTSEVESSKTLLFRFGGHFVFQVDETSILGVRYEPGSGNEVVSDKDINTNGEGDEKKESPPSKRQRNEGDGSKSTDNDLNSDKESAKIKNLPPSLAISFASCTLRVFSLQEIRAGSNTTDDVDATRPSSRIWGTLATDETVENQLMNARTILLQQFDIEEQKYNDHASLKMAPPGSGITFTSWPEVFETSSFHSSTLQYNGEEEWSACHGGKKQMIEYPEETSPQKSSSPSKSGSSSFEHGQQDKMSAPKNGSSSQSHSAPVENGNSGKQDMDHEKVNTSNDASELTHESHHSEEEKEEDESQKLPDSQSSMSNTQAFEDHKMNDGECNEENGKQSGISDGKQLDDDTKKMLDEDRVNTEDAGTGLPHSQKEGIYNKYHHFETSAIHMERAMDSASLMSKHKHQQNLHKSNLTNSAKSLSISYLSANEFMDEAQKCENEIGKITNEMEEVLATMFPARGKKTDTVTSSDQSEQKQKIEDLMASRREAVAAKLALLLIPKR